MKGDIDMAMAVKSIPVLKGNEAKEFVRKAEEAASRKGSVDFKMQPKNYLAILKKAKI